MCTGERSFSNSKILPTLIYDSEVWRWSEAEQFRVWPAEMSCMKATAGGTLMDIVNIEEVHQRL